MKQLFKQLITFAFGSLIVLKLLGVSPAWAADFTVTCDDTSGTSGDCVITPNPNQNLFAEYNWLPGDTVTRNFTVDNSGNPDACDLVMDTNEETQDPAGFATKLWTVIKYGLADLYGIRNGSDRATNNKTLDDLFNQGDLSLVVVPAGAIQVYNWTVTFDPDTGNDYQSARTEFDFDLTFTCGQEPSPTPSPTPTPSPSTGKTSSLSAQGVCPNSIYVTFDVENDGVAQEDVSVTFSYKGGNEVTKKTNANGRAEVTYTFSGPGEIKAVASDGYPTQSVYINNLVCPSPGLVLGTTTQAGAAGGGGYTYTGYLGVTTESTEAAVQGESTTEIVQPGKIQGTSCEDPYYLWWLPLVFQGFLTVFYYWFIWRRKDFRGWALFPIILAALSQLIHEVFGCNCATGKWCPWFWLFNLIILLVFSGFYYFKHRKTNS